MTDKRREQELSPLEWLRVFEAAGRSGNFTAAAHSLGLTQAAVSQRIRNLEHRLGKDLFKRKPRGVELTLDGEAYLPHVQSALAALARSTADLFSPAVSEITIAAMPSHIELLVLPRLKPFLANHPGLRVTFVSVYRQRDFDDAKADFHLRYGLGNWPGRRADLLHQELLAPAAAPSLLQAEDNWRKGPIIELSGPRSGWRAWSAATGSPAPLRSGLHFDSFDLVLNAAFEGLGAILASLPLCEAALATGRLARLPEPQVAMDEGYWLSWPVERQPLPIHRDLAAWLGAGLT
ncbi:MAG: LysR family transcriptional regulator [Hyphomicrobiales bacterium]|nr:LysR family transcriptional regulator [Hyphomicrobiales bacterium]MCP4999377.1 LysR family transcriptional regulator [Hyphomicrobiales bacterium]